MVTAGSLGDALAVVNGDPRWILSQPVLVIDLDRPSGSLAELRELRQSLAVLVGVGRDLSTGARSLAGHLDFTLAERDGGPAVIGCLDAGRSVDEVLAATLAHPRAATVLATILRQQGPIATGILLEASAFSALLGGAEFAAWLTQRPGRDTADEEDQILLRREGDALIITLDQPLRRNAFSRAMRDSLVDALTLAVVEPELTVTLRGNGPVFSSGGDLAEFGTTPDPATAWISRLSRNPGLLISQLSQRLTSRIHGRCAGAGVEIPLFAGRVIAAADTTLRLPEVSMGLIPGAGGTVSLARRTGRWRTCWLAMTGSELPVGRALTWGLVDELG